MITEMEKLLIVVLCIKDQFILITTFLQALHKTETNKKEMREKRNFFCCKKIYLIKKNVDWKSLNILCASAINCILSNIIL